MVGQVTMVNWEKTDLLESTYVIASTALLYYSSSLVIIN